MFKQIAGGAVLAAVLSAGGAQAAQAQVLQYPFKCGTEFKGQAYPGHHPALAIDFNLRVSGDADAGTPIVASGSGFAKSSTDGGGGYGHVIEIQHGDGRSSFYAHLDKLYVSSTGRQVKQGEVIGTMGRTGGQSNTHLHYEERRNGTLVKAGFEGAESFLYRAPYYDNETNLVSKNCGGGNDDGGGGTTPQPSAYVKLPASSFRFAARVQTDNGRQVGGRKAARTSSRLITRLVSGQAVRIVCQTRGQKVTGKYGTSNIWDLIDLGNGRGAFVTDTYVYTGKDGRVAPAC